ncbi:GntR family transcriptional regulator [Actinoplanes sp. NPDC089786]|uniref:GntR family transcriptional regulator n=1 Tax=Actinoplanes sp. NPDC089786 TaxID=3155185 RepID=UPI003424E55D
MTAPKYRLVAAELRKRITRGDLRPGDRLPTERELEAEFGVSRNTARDATALLINEGLVERVAGRTGGMVVREVLTLTYHASRAEMTDGLWPESDAWFGEVRAQGYEPAQDFRVEIMAVPAEIAERLSVEADSHAAVRRCVRLINGRPSSLQDTWYPMDLCELIPELLSPKDIPQGTTRLLAERGWPQPAVEDDLTAAMPTPDEARLLALPPGTPVLRFLRTGFSPQRPVRVSVTVFAGNMNRLIYTLGDPAIFAKFRDGT